VPLDAEPAFAHLAKWMSANGHEPPERPRLRPAAFPSAGRGVLAASSVLPGDVLAQIPMRLLVTREVALQRCKISAQIECVPSTHALLAAFLMTEKRKESSFWSPYLATLPENFASCAYFAADEERRHFPAYVTDRLEEQERSLERDRRSVAKCVDAFKEEDFKWAWFAVNTRAVYLRGSMALAPMLDMLNHSSEVEVTAGVDLRPCQGGGSCYQIVAHQATIRGEEVFINYGPHDSVKLAVEYGFCVPHNVNDGVPVSLQDIELALGVKASAKVAESLRRADLTSNMAICSDGATWNTLKCLSAVAADDAGHLFADDDQVVSFRDSLRIVLFKEDQVGGALHALTAISSPPSPAAATILGVLQEHLLILRRAKQSGA